MGVCKKGVGFFKLKRKQINKQIENYIKIFDYIYIITTKNHIDSLKKITQKSIGFFIIDNNIQKVKSARLNRKKSKKDILETIPAKALKKIFSIKDLKTYLVNVSWLLLARKFSTRNIQLTLVI